VLVLVSREDAIGGAHERGQPDVHEIDVGQRQD
jgi:hypothetical protein